MDMAKGLAVQLIASMILAFIGVALLISMFSSSYSGSFGGVYCSTYSKVLMVLPHHGGDAPIPRGCGDPDKQAQTPVIIKDPNDLALRLGGYILDCWEKYEGYGESREVCAGLIIDELVGYVDEKLITQKLISQQLCPDKIQNSELEESDGTGCGTLNQIIMPIEKIQDGDFITITFFNETIEVK